MIASGQFARLGLNNIETEERVCQRKRKVFKEDLTEFTAET